MPPPDSLDTTLIYSAGQVEVLQRLTRMETKLDQFVETRETAIRGEAAAQSALILAQENARDIQEVKESSKWLTRTTFVLVAGVLLSLVVNFLQGA